MVGVTFLHLHGSQFLFAWVQTSPLPSKKIHDWGRLYTHENSYFIKKCQYTFGIIKTGLRGCNKLHLRQIKRHYKNNK